MDVKRDPETQTQELAEALRRAIRREDLTYSEVERRLGMGKDYLRQLLGGRVDLKVKHLFAILDALGVPPRDFLAEFYGRRGPGPAPPYHPFGGRLGYFEGPAAGAGIPPAVVAFLARRLRDRGILTDEEAAGLVLEL